MASRSSSAKRATEPASWRVRPATPADLLPVARLWAHAFPGRSVEQRKNWIREGGRLGGLESVRIAEVDGEMVGALRLYGLELSLFGRPFSCAGVAGVAVSPDARRMGVASRLCAEALDEAHGRGDLISVLFPFRTAFYRRMGYVLAGELYRHRFPPGALASLPGRERCRLETVEAADDGVPEEVREVYARAAARSHGLLHRDAAYWEKTVGRGFATVIYRDREQRARGYLRLKARRDPETHRVVAGVRELVAESREAWVGLLGWIGAQGDQWAEVVYDALPGERLHHLLDEPRVPGTPGRRGLWFEAATVLRGPMVRLVNVPEALAAGGVDAEQIEREVAKLEAAAESGEGAAPSAGKPGSGTPAAEKGSGEPVALHRLTIAFLAGGLPGQGEANREWRPPLGIREFRLLDTF